MAFVRCPDCKRSTFAHAQVCPACGFPICAVDQPSARDDTKASVVESRPRKLLLGWAGIVVVLYVLIQAAFIFCAAGFRLEQASFVLLTVMLLCQAALLKVPVQVEGRRHVRRTALWIPIVMSGFFMGMTLVAFSLTLAELMHRHEILEPGRLFWLTSGLASAVWIYWGVVFWRMSRTSSVASVVTSQNRLLLRGSILELLIAVPTWVIARHRDECCAGLESGIGIWLGLSVALVAFGPSLFFLYAAKWRRLRRLA